MEPWMSLAILAAAILGGLAVGWFLARLRYRRAVEKPRRVERPGMRADQARMDQLEGELAIARRQLMRVSQRTDGEKDRLREADQAVATLRKQISARDARIADLESQLAAQRMAPRRVAAEKDDRSRAAAG